MVLLIIRCLILHLHTTHLLQLRHTIHQNLLTIHLRLLRHIMHPNLLTIHQPQLQHTMHQNLLTIHLHQLHTILPRLLHITAVSRQCLVSHLVAM